MKEMAISDESLSGFMRLNQILELIPVGKSTWWNGCKSGRFPKAYKLGPRTTAWKIVDIQQCIEKFKLCDDQ